MMGGMGGPLSSMLEPNKLQTDNKLTISWVDSSWVPHLNANNVMEYFSEQRNPFYDRTCNNEVLKMQRASLDQLANMTGIEYCLLYVQEPILYVIRKQQRHSPSHVMPIADYYIVAGTIYQAPDLGSVVNSRLLSAVSHLQGAFEEARGYAKYHPTRGYWWDFQQSANVPFGAKKAPNPADEAAKKSQKKKKESDPAKEEPSSLFQRKRVDYLLDILTKKFPFKQAAVATVPPPAVSSGAANAGDSRQTEAKSGTGGADDVKSEKGGTAAASGGGAESIKNERVEQTELQRGVKREQPASSSSSTSRPGSGLEPSKKMKFS